MSSEVSIVPSHRIRALNGPLQGATFLISSHVTIGRSCESDVQILQDGVSRRHAQIVTLPDGRHRVVDLSSANGTFVDDRRRRECMLEPGMVLRIARTRFVYEAIPRVELESHGAETFLLRSVGGEGLRAATAPQPEGAEGGLTSVRACVDLLAPARAAGPKPATGRPANGLDSGEREWLAATLPDGSRYPGDLLGDVVAYRSLRTKKLRGDELDDHEEQHFGALDACLRPPPDGSGARRYHRYACHFPAFIRLLAGRTLPVVVENLGVDGAKVCVPWHRLATNTIAWLAIDVVCGRQCSILVFSGRVVWWEREHLGLSFSGSPGWARRGGREPLVPTHVETRSATAPRLSMSLASASAEVTQRLVPDEIIER